ncbi:hypothetical protein C6558_11335 [Ensifer sp. NM-2]|nr:hypothetical protein C6558_11335 [Ensifer sp. NM-2]
MSRKSAQRFCDYDMRKNKSLERSKRIREIATRFSGPRRSTSWNADQRIGGMGCRGAWSNARCRRHPPDGSYRR